MEDLTIKDLLVTFGARNNKRRTKNEKIRFLTVLMDSFSTIGFQTTEILKQKVKKKSSFFGVVGELRQSDTLYVTYFDTPVVDFTRGEYIPFDDEQLKSKNTKNYVIPMLLSLVVLIGLVYFLLVPNFQDDVLTFMDFLSVLIILLVVIYTSKITKNGGVAKGENLVRNTSSVVALLEYAKTLSKKERKKSSFVFVDHGTSDNLGYYVLSEYIQDMNFKKIIILDSVGSGNVVYSTDNSEMLTDYFGKPLLVYGNTNSDDANIENGIKDAVKSLTNISKDKQ